MLVIGGTGRLEVVDEIGNARISFSDRDPARARQLDRLPRYEKMFSNQASRALAELRRLQTARALRAQLPTESTADAPPLASTALPQKRSQPKPLDALIDDDMRVQLHKWEVEAALLNARWRNRQTEREGPRRHAEAPRPKRQWQTGSHL